MATITPAFTQHGDAATAGLWEACATGDTIVSASLQDVNALVASVHMTGTWGGATVSLEISNDNSDWVIAKDVGGSAITLNADGLVEFSTAALYMRVAISGGSSDDVDVTVACRK